MTTQPLLDRFWAKVDKTDSCWLWTAAKGRNGYGLFTNGAGRLVPAHRFIWEVTYGEIPKGVMVCHNCPSGDNPSCVNPAHLWLGTHQANMVDRNMKGRAASGERHVSRTHPEVLMRGDTHYARTQPERLARGERHGMTPLTSEQVRTIRTDYAAGASAVALGQRYGVDRTTIHNIVTRKTWAHVE
jgi:hypothetical protein